MMNMIELFGGISAPKKGVQLANELLGQSININTLDYVEIDKHAVASHNAVWGTNYEPQDIMEYDKDFKEKVDIIFHGSPCQDFSLAGQGKGGTEGSGTRSSLMWHTVRLVDKYKPTWVWWENVKAVKSSKHIATFNKYLDTMTDMGYTNFESVLNSIDYGTGQNRERVFVISTLENVNQLSYPQPLESHKKLLEYLEPKVDDKYYLTAEQISRIMKWKSQRNPIEEAKNIGDPFMHTLTAKGNTSMNASMLLIKEPLTGISHAVSEGGGQVIVPSANKQGFELGNIGDGIYLNRPHQKRGTVQDKSVPTIKTNGNDIGVIVKADGNYTDASEAFQSKPFEGASRTIKATVNDAGVVETYDSGLIRIRKLTPLECWRLMEFDDEDYYKAAEVSSATQLYKQAGNSIVALTIAHMFRAVYGDQKNASPTLRWGKRHKEISLF